MVLVALAFLICSLPVIEVRATTFVPLPLPELTAASPIIAHGTVGASHSEWERGADGGKTIFTYCDLNLREVLKEAPKSKIPGSVQIRELGGEKDGVGMQVSGAAVFHPGEDVVVLLGDVNDDGSYDVHGLSSGKFNIERQDDGRECLSGIALPESAKKCAWDLASLRRLVHEQGGVAALQTQTLPVPSPSSLSSPALGLQTSQGGGLGVATHDHAWIVVFAFAVIGFAALLFIRPRQ